MKLETSTTNYNSGKSGMWSKLSYKRKNKKKKVVRKGGHHIKKKNCLGCRAYKDNKCLLNIPIKVLNNNIDRVHLKIHSPVLGMCPKPRTVAQFEKAKPEA